MESFVDEPLAGYAVYNNTDNVYFDPRTFASQAEAWAAAEDHRNAYRTQGYYLTSGGFRISPDEIELEVVPVEG